MGPLPTRSCSANVLIISCYVTQSVVTTTVLYFADGSATWAGLDGDASLLFYLPVLSGVDSKVKGWTVSLDKEFPIW